MKWLFATIVVLGLAVVVFLLLAERDLSRADDNPDMVESDEHLGTGDRRPSTSGRGTPSAIIASGDPPEPKTYPSQKGEWGLLNPMRVGLDDELRAAAQAYATMDDDERSKRRSDLPADAYALLKFAKRSAVFALRSGDLELVRDGLRTIAMLDTKRIDYRDILMAIAVLFHATQRLGADPAAEFAAAAALAPEGTADHLNRFPGSDARRKNLSASWGYREVELPSGIGLADTDFAPDDPQFDLMQLGVGLANTVDADEDYSVSKIKFATKLNKVWLEGVDDERLEAALANATAGVSVSAKMNPDAHADASSQSFNIYTVELGSPADAEALLLIADRLRDHPRAARIGFANDRVFSLVVARSFVSGVPTVEQRESLERFAAGISTAMAELKPPDE